MKKMISRRNFLKVCAVAGSAVALSACGGSKKAAAPDPSNTDQTSFDIVGGQSALSPGYNDNGNGLPCTHFILLDIFLPRTYTEIKYMAPMKPKMTCPVF